MSLGVGERLHSRLNTVVKYFSKGEGTFPGMKSTTTRHREAHRAREWGLRLGVWDVGLRFSFGLRVRASGLEASRVLSEDSFSYIKTSRGTTYTGDPDLPTNAQDAAVPTWYCFGFRDVGAS